MFEFKRPEGLRLSIGVFIITAALPNDILTVDVFTPDMPANRKPVRLRVTTLTISRLDGTLVDSIALFTFGWPSSNIAMCCITCTVVCGNSRSKMTHLGEFLLVASLIELANRESMHIFGSKT